MLAISRLGLGRVAALTTDLSGGWTADWLSSSDLSLLLSRLVSALWPETAPVQVSWTREGEWLQVTVDVSSGGKWVNGLALSGRLVGPEEHELYFSQVAPGRYRARIGLPPPGAYPLILSEPGGTYGGSYAPDELLPPPPGGGRQGVPVGRAFLWAAAGFLLVDLLLRKLLA